MRRDQRSRKARRVCALLTVFCFLFSATVFAERMDVMQALYEAQLDEINRTDNKRGFSLDGEVGLIYATGNTESATLNMKLNSRHETDDWSNQYLLEALGTRSRRADLDEDSQTTAQRISGSVQADYKLLDKDERIFIFADYEDNRFNGFDYQASVAAGWAELRWKDDTSSFRYSIGPGYNMSSREDNTLSDLDGMIIRASAEYSYEWPSGARLRQTISTIAGDESTRSRAETSISANVIDALAMKLSVRIDHNSSPAIADLALDTETSISLVYHFF